ncbi:MAG: hypothetical protein ACR2RB_11315 [Gammaproteobacteria bacterium]
MLVGVVPEAIRSLASDERVAGLATPARKSNAWRGGLRARLPIFGKDGANAL